MAKGNSRAQNDVAGALIFAASQGDMPSTSRPVLTESDPDVSGLCSNCNVLNWSYYGGQDKMGAIPQRPILNELA